jgi:hypothetical protein
VQRKQAKELYTSFVANGKLQPGLQRWRVGGVGRGADVPVVLHVNRASQLGESAELYWPSAAT